MVKYIKCPRCELNYIDSETQEYCDVCLAEMKGRPLQFADLDDDDLEEIDEVLDSDEICPVCGVNPIRPGEKMCESCRSQQDEYEEDEDVDMDKDEEWKNYLDEDDSDLTVDDKELEEELKADLDEEEEDEMYDGEEDDPLDDEDMDSLEDLEDDDFDDDEEDEDDDDDDF